MQITSNQNKNHMAFTSKTFDKKSLAKFGSVFATELAKNEGRLNERTQLSHTEFRRNLFGDLVLTNSRRRTIGKKTGLFSIFNKVIGSDSVNVSVSTNGSKVTFLNGGQVFSEGILGLLKKAKKAANDQTRTKIADIAEQKYGSAEKRIEARRQRIIDTDIKEARKILDTIV